jgi:hypothetical protein
MRAQQLPAKPQIVNSEPNNSVDEASGDPAA